MRLVLVNRLFVLFIFKWFKLLSRNVNTTIRMTAVALPLVGNEIDERLVPTRRISVAVIVFFATSLQVCNNVFSVKCVVCSVL